MGENMRESRSSTKKAQRRMKAQGMCSTVMGLKHKEDTMMDLLYDIILNFFKSSV